MRDITNSKNVIPIKFLQKEVGAVLEDTRRFGERFSNISKSQNKISQEFRELSISVEKIINNLRSINYKEWRKKITNIKKNIMVYDSDNAQLKRYINNKLI